MKKIKFNFNIDWKSIIIELLIVIIGISIAFKLNTWNESKKVDLEVKDYIASFKEENISNETNLILAVEYSISIKKDVDTLKQILTSGEYNDSRIINLSASMMGLSSFVPSEITMENIKASGDFDLIKDNLLRKKLISTYKSYDTSLMLEGLLSDYLNTYLTPFFMENIRFSDFSSLHNNFIENPKFENIVFGYEVLLNQQITGYQDNLEKVRQLNAYLLSKD
jgi:hypothetical protein